MEFLVFGQQIRTLGQQPLPGMSKQRFGLGLALANHSVGNRIAFVIVEVALTAQSVEDGHIGFASICTKVLATGGEFAVTGAPGTVISMTVPAAVSS